MTESRKINLTLDGSDDAVYMLAGAVNGLNICGLTVDDIENVAGSSSAAIVALLIALNYSQNEMLEKACAFDATQDVRTQIEDIITSKIISTKIKSLPDNKAITFHQMNELGFKDLYVLTTLVYQLNNKLMTQPFVFSYRNAWNTPIASIILASVSTDYRAGVRLKKTSPGTFIISGEGHKFVNGCYSPTASLARVFDHAVFQSKLNPDEYHDWLPHPFICKIPGESNTPENNDVSFNPQTIGFKYVGTSVDANEVKIAGDKEPALLLNALINGISQEQCHPESLKLNHPNLLIFKRPTINIEDAKLSKAQLASTERRLLRQAGCKIIADSSMDLMMKNIKPQLVPDDDIVDSTLSDKTTETKPSSSWLPSLSLPLPSLSTITYYAPSMPSLGSVGSMFSRRKPPIETLNQPTPGFDPQADLTPGGASTHSISPVDSLP